MIEYQEGAKVNSVCAYCEKSVTSTLTKVTLSLCEGLEEVDNVLVDVCDECGNMCSIPHQSVLPIQEGMKKLVESGAVTDRGDIPVELKSVVDSRKSLPSKTEQNYPQEYPLVAAAG